ncbi:hypothetical protein Tco_0702605 [Tanacetum coccineum]|uniref:Uncharacterized protein n=1 Tax=Tanacetum coccineum TaxID=301880 RepID=A0ABQ4XWR2_9ASTR
MMEECHKLLTNQIDLVNPEGHRIVPDISNPLPLGGPPGQEIGLKTQKKEDKDFIVEIKRRQRSGESSKDLESFIGGRRRDIDLQTD